MGIKKRNKVSAEFSMSSLTDIIFLLLIFFMLTSSLVAPNSLNLKLPGTSKIPSTDSSNLDNVSISSNGDYYLNGRRVNFDELDSDLGNKARASRKTLTITISPSPQAPTESVVKVMDIALRRHIDAILAAEVN
ncbi:MAG: biopolymer transporter ExbD [Saprospiraceae bacterium]|nr:biopolymer transporter ExbD [Saprospiraceae bacterium]